MDYITLVVKILYSKNDLTSERPQQPGWYSSVRKLGQQIAHILEEWFSHKANMSPMRTGMIEMISEMDDVCMTWMMRRLVAYLLEEFEFMKLPLCFSGNS